MSSDAFTPTEASDPCEVDPVTGFERRLSAILEQEYLLQKVLMHIVEDGLHECRLVCRRWRDACRRLPVKLGEILLPSDRLERAAELFPEADKLTIAIGIDDDNIEEAHIIPHLLRLKNLKHFSPVFCGGDIDLQNLVVACLPSIQHLQSLELWIEHDDTLICFINNLRYLKNLTSLCFGHRCSLRKDLDPDSEVRGLRNLKTDFGLLVNRRNELVFPMLTGLTSLIIRGPSFRRADTFALNLQSIVPYATNLQSLGFQTVFEESSLIGPSPWMSFLHLSSLEISILNQRDMSFFEALQQMDQLTRLDLNVTSEKDKRGLLESMASLTRLRSLALSSGHRIPYIPSEITERLTFLTQLTQLCLYDLPGDHPLRFPESTLNLTLGVPKIYPEDLLEDLMNLTNLTRLTIYSKEETHLSHSDSVTPFDFFKERRQLKTLRTRNICLDPPFLDAFKALTGLTQLCLSCAKLQMDHGLVCPQLTLLSNLEVLEIPFPKLLVDSETGVPRGSLPKLKNIRRAFPHIYIGEDTSSAMAKVFPCFRSL